MPYPSVDGPHGAAHRAAGGAPSLSLVGNDAIALHTRNCTWTGIPSNSRQRRCPFELAGMEGPPPYDSPPPVSTLRVVHVSHT